MGAAEYRQQNALTRARARGDRDFNRVPLSAIIIFAERCTKANGFFAMEPSTQYRKFAGQCRRFAESAKTDVQRTILLEMAALWTKLAGEAEQKAAESND